MSQIAQQDHLYLDLSKDFDEAQPVMAEVGKKLYECLKAGTILDVVLRYRNNDGVVSIAPILFAYFIDTTLTVSWMYEDTVTMGTYTVE